MGWKIETETGKQDLKNEGKYRPNILIKRKIYKKKRIIKYSFQSVTFGFIKVPYFLHFYQQHDEIH